MSFRGNVLKECITLHDRGFIMSEEATRHYRPDFRELLKIKIDQAQKHNRFKSLAKKGECMFTLKEAMDTLNPIARLFKMICIKKHVTEDELFDKHKLYCEEKLGIMPTQTNTDKHNLRKALAKPSMTVNVMAKLLEILGYNIVDISYTIMDKETGKIEEFKYTDTELFNDALGPNKVK